MCLGCRVVYSRELSDLENCLVCVCCAKLFDLGC